MPSANVIDCDKFVNEFDISILNDNYIPSGSERSLLYSFHRLLSATDYRLKRCKIMNEGGLSRWDFKLKNIYFNYDTGYFRLNKDLKSLNRQIDKFTETTDKMIDKFENMESNIICKEFMEWIIEWPSPFTQSMISNNWPNLLQSPCYEVASCLWQSQIRKIIVNNSNNNNNKNYKLGIFITPKQIKQFKYIISLNAKIKIIICIQYKELKESLQIKTKDITFDIDTNFIKLQDKERKVMSWGKFIPELQDVIDHKTGLIPHENVNISVKFQIIDQCITYKHPRS